MYDTILVPVDESETSRRALEHSLKLAVEVDSSVDILHVVSIDESREVEARRIEDGFLYRDLKERGLARIDEHLPAEADEDISISRNVSFGRPDKEILKYIDSEDPDIVLMGTQGKTGVKRLLLGSVAENVTRRSPIPVQLVQPPGQVIPEHILDS